MSQPVSAFHPPVPGPHDRVRFEQMQARQRRAARWYAALGALAVIAAGVPVSLVVTPVIFVVGLLVVRVAGLSLTIPPAVPALASEIDVTMRHALATAIALRWPSIDSRAALLLFAPGAAAMVILWILVRRLLQRAGAGSALLALGARKPASLDFQEYQLQNAVGEMAIAAGTAPPAIRLLDVDAANAASIGMGPHDAALVITRGLLERLNREETQAVVGHLIASIGDGDLTASTLLLSIQQTLGLLIVILNAPFGPASRGVLRILIHRRGTQETTRVAELLSGAPLESEDDVARQVKMLGSGSALRVLPRIFMFPLLFPALAARVAATFVISGLFGPVFAAIWRRRRRIADAMAVQLTRNPDSLASALRSLTSTEHHVDGALGSAHLFIVWQPEQTGQYLSRVFGGLGTLSPSISRRLEALRRMGAGSVTLGRRTWGWRDLLREPTRTILLVIPALVIVGGYAAALTLWAMITFNFLFLGLLVVGLRGLLDLAGQIIAHLG